MKSARSTFLSLFVIAATLTQGSDVLAAQRPTERPLYNDMERFLSPNELQLAELQRERQDLLKSRENEKNVRILKNKITILNNKIAYIQRQIKLTNPYMVTQRLVPLTVKGAQSAERLEPMVTVVSAPRADAAPRERAATQELAVPMKPVAGVAPPVERKPGAGKTGADWKGMSTADKEIYILSIMGSLSRRDVYLMKPYGFYIQIIDKAIAKNPLLEQEFIHRILMIAAYDSEPDSRKHLEKVWK